jgi:DNA-directed RNA polymerase specialized sigma24 family protein
VPSPLASMSTEELYKKLTAHALLVCAQYGFRGEGAVIQGVAKSAEDFASDLLLKYLTGKIKVKELPYLFTALRHDIISKLKSAAQKKTEYMPAMAELDEFGQGTTGLDGFPSGQQLVDDRLCEESFETRVRACVAADPELVELFEAVFDLNLRKPAEIAAVIGISAKEVDVRKRKLRRWLIKHGIKKVKS